MVFVSFWAEIFFVSVLLLQLGLNSSLTKVGRYNFPIIIKEVGYQTIFILLILLLLFWNSKAAIYSTGGMLVFNSAIKWLKFFSVGLSIITVYMLIPILRSLRLNFYEVFLFVIFSILSLLLLISSTNLLSFYIVLEMQTISFYVLSAYSRKSSFSSEAGLKYFIAGSFMSGCFLLGTVLIFSVLGTLSLNEISTLLLFKVNHIIASELLFVGVLLILSTLLFKLACAPFHIWAPDVYEGAPLSSSLIFAIIPKLGIIYFFNKFLVSLGFFLTVFQPILLLVGVFSCLLGTLFSLNQLRLKRLLVYSSIAQVGFIVAGLALNSVSAFNAVFIFLVIYLLTSVLVWGNLAVFYYFEAKSSSFFALKPAVLQLTSLSGLFTKNKAWATSLLLTFFSLAGIPPLTGFLVKVLILLELNLSDNYLVSSLLIVISSLSVFYYLRFIKSIIFEPTQLHSKTTSGFQIIFHDSCLSKIYFIFSGLLFCLVIIFFFPTNLYVFCTYISFYTFF